MAVLKAFGIAALALLLLSLVRLGVLAEFGESGLAVRIKAGPLQFTVFPGKPREKRGKKKPPKAKRRKKGPGEPPAARRGGALALAKTFLPLVADAAGRLKRAIRIDRFYMDLTMAAPDPALAAMCFGGANAVLGMLWPPVEQNFNVKDWRLRTAVDFGLQAPVVWIQAAATLTAGQMAGLGVHLAIRALKILRARQAAERAGAPARNGQKEAV